MKLTATFAACAVLALAGCGGMTIGEDMRAECEAEYPNSPQAVDNCTAEKEAAWIDCRTREKAYGVKLEDTDCR